jgi:enamine deaminase RidA (YjgF/YER057c/UK114 family)
MRTYIPMSAGINELGKTLQLTFGLEFQGFLRKRVREALQKSDNKVSMKLRDRVLKDAKVLPNTIVDVSSFIDSMVDVNLMDDCAKELATRFEKVRTQTTPTQCFVSFFTSDF